MAAKKEIALGAFFLTAIGVLAYYTLFLTDLDLFGAPVMLSAEFESANGLREGDPVTVSGMRVGRVKRILFRPEQERERRILIEMKLTQPLGIHEGYQVTIQETTLLGGRNVDIEPGRPDAPPVDAGVVGPLHGTVSGNPLDALRDAGAIFSENRERVGELLENLRGISTDVRTGEGPLARLVRDEQMAADFAAAIRDFAAFSAEAKLLVTDLREGPGTLGRLIREDELYNRVNAAAGDLAAITAEARAGRGVVGALLYDEALRGEVDRAIRNITAVTDDIAAGKGTLGKLLRDEGLAVRLDRISANVEKVSGDLAEGRGTIGQLVGSREMYDQWLAISDDLRAASGAIRLQEGSLGALIMNRELYDEVVAAVKLLNRTLEDYREAAPISTFTSIFFGAF